MRPGWKLPPERAVPQSCATAGLRVAHSWEQSSEDRGAAYWRVIPLEFHGNLASALVSWTMLTATLLQDICLWFVRQNLSVNCLFLCYLLWAWVLLFPEVVIREGCGGDVGDGTCVPGWHPLRRVWTGPSLDTVLCTLLCPFWLGTLSMGVSPQQVESGAPHQPGTMSGLEVILSGGPLSSVS